jgi:hypothetical protein
MEPITRACAWCEKEFGVKYPGDVSHGTCRRHTIKFLKTANIPDDSIEDIINRSEVEYVDDLAEHPEIVAKLKGEPEDEGPGPDDFENDGPDYWDADDQRQDRQLFPRN